MNHGYYNMWKDLAKYLQKKTSYEVVIYPAKVRTERLHISMIPLIHPQIQNNGQISFFIYLQTRSKSPSSSLAISQATDCFIKMAEIFSQPRGGVLAEGISAMLYSQDIEEKIWIMT